MQIPTHRVNSVNVQYATGYSSEGSLCIEAHNVLGAAERLGHVHWMRSSPPSPSREYLMLGQWAAGILVKDAWATVFKPLYMSCLMGWLDLNTVLLPNIFSAFVRHLAVEWLTTQQDREPSLEMNIDRCLEAAEKYQKVFA